MDAIDITKREIKWHNEHRGEGISPFWEKGFIAGMEHLLNLFSLLKDEKEEE